jgi:predicted TIM-barrel fold metal-dependent hydrolase
MMVIDAHTHVGVERFFSIIDKPEDIIYNMEKYNVDKAMVQPQVGSPTIKKDHELIAEMAEKYPGRIYGIASFNPFCDENEYIKDVTWAIKDLKFKAVKLHTIGYVASPLNPYSRKVFQVGSDLHVPVMVHTGNGIPLSLPSLVIPMARAFPDLPIILAHAGAGILSDEAIVVAQETSWVSVINLMNMVKLVGEKRLMFGSDVLQNVPVYLEMYRSIGLTQEQLEWCLGLTAKTVFKID